MRNLLAGLLVCLAVEGAWAQPGATGPVATLNAEAERDDHRAAYQHQVQYQQAREKMFSVENASRFQRLQVAQEAEREQHQIQLLEQQGRVRDAELAQTQVERMALGVIAGLVILSLALLHARFRIKQESEARFRLQAETLAEALEKVQTLRGMLPICAWCKKIRDDKGYWTAVESYVALHSAAEFTHAICPSCADDTLSQPEPGRLRTTRPARLS